MEQKTKEQQFIPDLHAFIRFSLVGFGTFIANIVMLYLLREFLDIRYYIAVPVAFAVGAVVHYFIVRKYIFAGTERQVHEGLLYFLLFSLVDAAIVTVGVTLLVEEGHFNVYLARTDMAFVGGILNFILNARYNFKML